MFAAVSSGKFLAIGMGIITGKVGGVSVNRLYRDKKPLFFTGLPGWVQRVTPLRFEMRNALVSGRV
jgi:hypothetical protein